MMTIRQSVYEVAVVAAVAVVYELAEVYWKSFAVAFAVDDECVVVVVVVAAVDCAFVPQFVADNNNKPHTTNVKRNTISLVFSIAFHLFNVQHNNTITR
eukprot:m.107525 g.107525  ORF g.107525 m.107525 type:complete len:99 (+) comp12690_c2_seq2:1814-2110(+)